MKGTPSPVIMCLFFILFLNYEVKCFIRLQFTQIHLPDKYNNIEYAQRLNVTKYVHSSTVLQYSFEVVILYMSIFIFCYFLLPLRILKANVVLYTPLYLSDNFSYFLDYTLHLWDINTLIYQQSNKKTH